jgi:carbon-monoxide dehydrogenase large subunit
VLGIDTSEIRVISPDVGGNFGTRNRVYIEFGLVLFAAKRSIDQSNLQQHELNRF